MLGKSNKEFVVPYKQIVPYQEVLIKLADAISTKNPVGLGVSISAMTIICLFYYIIDPPVLTSIAICMLVCIWIDYLLPFLKNSEEQSLVKDEKLKDIYHKYVYVATYCSKLWTTVRSYRKDNEYVYIAFATMSLVTLAVLGKSINNILLFWAVSVSSIAVLAAYLDGELKTR